MTPNLRLSFDRSSFWQTSKTLTCFVVIASKIVRQDLAQVATHNVEVKKSGEVHRGGISI